MKHLIVIAFLLVAVPSFAQHHITVEVGPGLPAGELGRTNGDVAGYAKPAVSFGANYRYQFSDHLGVAVSGSYQSFEQDKLAIKYGSRTKNILNPFSGIRNIFSLSERESHTASGGFVGPAIQLGSEKNGAVISFQAGYMELDYKGYRGSLPSDRLQYGQPGNEVTVVKTSGKVADLAYKTRLGYYYSFTDLLRISLSANLTYLPSYPRDVSIIANNVPAQGDFVFEKNSTVPIPDLLLFRPAIGFSLHL